MKRAIMLIAVFITAQIANATTDIGFSTDEGGYWSYEKSIFSFNQPVVIDLVQGDTSDALVGAFIELPDLEVINFNQIPMTEIYQGMITPVRSQIMIRDAKTNAPILTGELGIGSLFTMGSAAMMYPTAIQADIRITDLDVASNSLLIQGYNIGDLLDFDLTLQNAGLNLSSIIVSDDYFEGDTLSGSMTRIVPEPMTIVLLGLGSLVLRKGKGKAA